MIIELDGMKFRACHGCLEHERRDGNDFEVDLRMEVPGAARAAMSDSLEDTLDYGVVYRTVAAAMETPSNLLEHVAGRIGLALHEGFPQITDFSVRVSKANPPVDGPVQWSRVTVTKKEMGL